MTHSERLEEIPVEITWLDRPCPNTEYVGSEQCSRALWSFGVLKMTRIIRFSSMSLISYNEKVTMMQG